jgi:hypothetical protein
MTRTRTKEETEEQARSLLGQKMNKRDQQHQQQQEDEEEEQEEE